MCIESCQLINVTCTKQYSFWLIADELLIRSPCLNDCQKVPN